MMDCYNFNLAKALVDLFPNIGIDLAKFGKHVRAERGRAGAKKKRERGRRRRGGGEVEERARRGRFLVLHIFFKLILSSHHIFSTSYSF